MVWPKSLIPLALVLGLFLAPERARAQMDPRIKTLGVITAYGIVGGALLGTATLAFNTRGRSPFIGASLGLYAGLLFGGYIVAGHLYRRYRINNPTSRENYYPDTNSLYEDMGEGGGGFEGGNIYEYWHPITGPEYERKLRPLGRKFSRPLPPLYIEVLNIQF